jgi:16S rRNA C1402 (ribose-2'-O) methylase RsmI
MTLGRAWAKYILVGGLKYLKLDDTLNAIMQAAEAEQIVLFVDELVKTTEQYRLKTLDELKSTMDSFRKEGDPATRS